MIEAYSQNNVQPSDPNTKEAVTITTVQLFYIFSDNIDRLKNNLRTNITKYQNQPLEQSIANKRNSHIECE